MSKCSLISTTVHSITALIKLDETSKKRPKPEHKRSNFTKTELTKASIVDILNFKPPILVVKIFELLELKPAPNSTLEGKREDEANTPSKAISESKTEATSTEPTKERAPKDSTMGTNSTKLNFLRIPETWSVKSSRECFKDAKRATKRDSSIGKKEAPPPNPKAPDEEKPKPEPEPEGKPPEEKARETT
ncbi:hypothetical protein G9A89_014615 [Geosiphon pyriformis]|nr:hypothetical protein G9A89_014615 [Geosiphon pyriformis]